MCIATNCSWFFVYWVIILECIFVTSCVLFYYVCTAVVHTLVPGLLARSHYLEGPPTSHLGTGFSWFPCVYKQMLRWFPRLEVATACLSCSPPALNFIDPYFIFMYVHYNHFHRGDSPFALKYIIIIIIIIIIHFILYQDICQ